jgi:hypothetical protein
VRHSAHVLNPALGMLQRRSRWSKSKSVEPCLGCADAARASMHARAFVQAGKSLVLPAKWFAVGQCWRYERMTRGRRREHYQWNMDIVGVAGVEAEAELLAAITTFFKAVGLTSQDVGIKVNNRKVLQAVLERYETPEELFAPVCGTLFPCMVTIMQLQRLAALVVDAFPSRRRLPHRR